MDMRNRHDGGGSPGWWDDLPPRVRERFGGGPPPAPLPRLEPPSGGDRPAAARGVAGDLFRLALLFLGVAVANLTVLLLALFILRAGVGPGIPLIDPPPAPR